jgi:transcriptional antiterminator NusG
LSFSAIFIVRVKNGKEKDAALAFKEKAEFNKRNISTILSIENINSYIFVEGEKNDVAATCQDLTSQYRTKILGKTTLEELEKHLEPKPTILALTVGDIVEVVSGPFKGSTAKISSMTETREEIQIELLDSRIRIPIVIHADYVRKIDSGN